MDVSVIFEWLEDAAAGGLNILSNLANGVGKLFYTVGSDNGIEITFLGVLTVAGVGAPLAWKFIKYVVSLFKKVRPN